MPSSTIPTKAPDHVPSSTRTRSGEAPRSPSLLRPGLGGDAMLGRGCVRSLPQQPGRPPLRLAHSHPYTLQRPPIGARWSRGNWLELTKLCLQQLFPWTCRGKWKRGFKMCSPSSGSSRLFPWEAENTGVVRGEGVFPFGNSHLQSIPLPQPGSRTFAAPPPILECPQELRHARQRDPEPCSAP